MTGKPKKEPIDPKDLEADEDRTDELKDDELLERLDREYWEDYWNDDYERDRDRDLWG